MSKLRFIQTSRGFTLIETMIIVAIIGVLAGLTIPGFSNYLHKQKVIGARNELMADLQSADADPNFYPWGLSDACNVQVHNFKLTSNVNLLPNGTVTYD